MESEGRGGLLDGDMGMDLGGAGDDINIGGGEIPGESESIIWY